MPIALEDDTDCGFPVYIEGTGTDVNISWTLADGTARSVDAFTNAKATVTNLDTGKSVTVNDAGSGHATFTANGATFISTGPAFIFNFSGLPGIHWVAGRFVLSVDATGAHLQILGGTVRDLCAAVAP